MSYEPKRSTILASILQGLSAIVGRWPLLVVVAFFYFKEGPHLRVTSTYQGSRDYPRYISCTYLGSRGLVPGFVPGCPIVAWIDTREAVQ